MLLKGRLILVVDDDHDICLVVGMMLHKHGAVILKAGTLGEALICIQTLACDLVVTDMNMPDGGGRALLGVVTKLGIPVVAMSGALDAYLAKGPGGFDGAVAKPFTEEELMDVVMSCFAPVSRH